MGASTQSSSQNVMGRYKVDPEVEAYGSPFSGPYELESKLLKGGDVGDYLGDYCKGY